MWKKSGNPLKVKKRQRDRGPELACGNDLVPIRDRVGRRVVPLDDFKSLCSWGF